MLNTAIVPSSCLCGDDGGYESACGLFRLLIDAAPQQTEAPKLLRLREQTALIKFNVGTVAKSLRGNSCMGNNLPRFNQPSHPPSPPSRTLNKSSTTGRTILLPLTIFHRLETNEVKYSVINIEITLSKYIDLHKLSVRLTVARSRRYHRRKAEIEGRKVGRIESEYPMQNFPRENHLIPQPRSLFPQTGMKYLFAYASLGPAAVSELPAR
ncbi:hypothetical protein ALC62_15312 [Cyphomyrmex costatus]|uniref:Uncharacterized protein n=1 Tax=Cyphomyrmex costatus TaxID=456900 RepID=A0A151I7D4_9HYME|nr:hypothetical protein ALC62_15312 [Cyphomyrmex costatus]